MGLNWKKFKDMCCPKCGGNISKDKPFGLLNKKIIYSCLDCDFFITSEKFEEIVTSLYQKKVKPQFEEVDRSNFI